MTLNILLKENLFSRSLSLLNLHSSYGWKPPAFHRGVSERWRKHHGRQYLFVIDVHK